MCVCVRAHACVSLILFTVLRPISGFLICHRWFPIIWKDLFSRPLNEVYIYILPLLDLKNIKNKDVLNYKNREGRIKVRGAFLFSFQSVKHDLQFQFLMLFERKRSKIIYLKKAKEIKFT